MGLVLGLGPATGVQPAPAQTRTADQRTPCEGGEADQYPCKNVDLLSHLSLDALGGGFSTELNDIWGWTDPQTGDEYAIVGRTDGTAFVDVSDPTNPVYLGELLSHSGSSTWRDVKVYDNHAYIVSEAGGHGLQVFDLTQLRSVDDPPATFEETAHYDRFSTAHNVAVNPESGYAYVVGLGGGQDVPDSADCGAGLHIVDISTPDQPEFAGCHLDQSTGGQVAPGYTHDTQCVMYEGPDTDYQDREVCFNANESQLNIADVTEKDAPETIANATYPLTGYAHQAWLTEDQEYLLVDDETDEQSFSTIGKTRTLVFDVSDLDNPELVTRFFGETEAIDHNQYVKGPFSYQANYESGLRILNVSDPENPVEIGYFDTYPSANSAAFNGAWSNYPFFDSGIVIVSSIGEGLFVLDPTVPSFTAPTEVSTEEIENGQAVRLQWRTSATSKSSSSARGDAAASSAPRHHIYRSTTPIDSAAGPAARTPLDSVSSSSFSYTDTTVTRGETYHYRVTAVDSSGTESSFSAGTRVFLYPDALSVSVRRAFDDAATASDYRLAALPGQVDRSVRDAVSGEAGVQWQAYADDGSDSDFLVEYDGSDTFTFRKGNGFWLTATSEWTFEESIPTVELRGDSATAIGLREGWNVISNPLDKDVDWAAVEAATGADLQPIWAFGGSFDSTDTFASAATGEAYYFFNDTDRDSLVIPYPGASGNQAAPKAASEAPPMLALTATPADGGGSSSTVQVGVSETRRALVGPPGRFEETSLRIAADDPQSDRAALLMAERRPMEGEGETFRLRLRSQADGPVTLSAENLDAIEGRSLALFHPAAGEVYDLQGRSTVEVEPGDESVQLKVAIGTEAYVKNQSETVLPEQVRLASYPNPLGDQGTIAYTLPEPTEVTLRMYDALGRTVSSLASGPKKAGRHTVRPEMDDLSSGVYFLRLRAAEQTVTRKVTVVR